MLINLYVKNFAIINEVNIEFDKGLNILSGETGSGKSLLLRSLSALKGERFSKEYIGNFADNTIVEATFTSNEKIKSLLEDADIESDDNVILTRIFNKNTSITKVNNRACNLKFLQNISDLLFDLHGQHSQLIVLDKKNYISIIDSFNDESVVIKDNLRENIKQIKELEIENSKLDISDDELEREKDLLNYQINEIEAFNFDNYDEDKLDKEYKKLSNQAQLITTTSNILDAINYSSRTHSLKDMINLIHEKIEDLVQYDESVKNIASDALNIRELIYDLADDIERYSSTLEIDDERIQIIEDIFAAFQNLKLKYGRTSEEILEYLSQIKGRYKTLNNIDLKRKEIFSEIDRLSNDNKLLADKLTDIRKTVISKLEKDIILELIQMNMSNIQFEIQMKSDQKITASGQDDIDFMISTNKGQELKSLSMVSSGGEISRFMLALKAVFIDKENINTIIFDEIDTGISGKTADIVGNKLKKISKKCQLLVISHLSQIASKADSHYLLSKETDENFTFTSIVKLNEKDRIKEVARLISGSDITDNSLQAAEELIKESIDE